jgi:hypothetical protein
MNELNKNFIDNLQYFFEFSDDEKTIEFSIDDLRCVLDGFIRFFLRYKQIVSDDQGLILFQLFLSVLNDKMQPYSNNSIIQLFNNLYSIKIQNSYY